MLKYLPAPCSGIEELPRQGETPSCTSQAESSVDNISLHWATLWTLYRADDPWLRSGHIFYVVQEPLRRGYPITEVQWSNFTDWSRSISKLVVTDVVIVRVDSTIQMQEHAEMDNLLFWQKPFLWSPDPPINVMSSEIRLAAKPFLVLVLQKQTKNKWWGTSACL